MTMINRCHLALIAVLAGLPLLASATTVQTRYGKAETGPEGNSFALSFDGMKVSTFEGLDVDLHHVTGNGSNEYLIVDNFLPGLHCRHQFSVLEISPAGMTALSKPFGKCTELEGAEYLADGVVVQTRSPSVEGKKKQKLGTYKWSKGILAEQR